MLPLRPLLVNQAKTGRAFSENASSSEQMQPIYTFKLTAHHEHCLLLQGRPNGAMTRGSAYQALQFAVY